MTRYYVHVEHYWTYAIDADSPEDAEQIVIDGDGPHGECTGYSTAAVTLDEYGDGDDQRQPGRCKGCAKKLEPGRNECTTCLLARLDAERGPLAVGR